MKPLRHFGFAFLLVSILAIAWWLAGQPQATPSPDRLTDRASTEGPIEPAFCGPLRPPMPPPPMDSPFGIHLYATTAKGIIHPLPVMEIVDALPAPEGTPSPKITHNSAIPKNETLYDDVQTVTILLEEFRRAFGAMPTGELNDEIVRRLQGENPKGIAVLPKTHPSISPEGELLDRYGTPYRFHPESAWQTTIRSAGPDKEMWTSDDQLSEGESGVLQL
ncbi:hypothetical protein EI77_00024 [Prosthecobacter fusiformis]|uniref:Type II secretion system protein GspG C-terminal domain-containing protein n=1 Tax=Prosthecobacter fusiformis TaxID=48464 RepID=A0A4R7SRE3_9BACT|nr:hypothetical protein [Prosthecobacter fusiformis]TDU80727.1 hypothetical protein EI77_00024 [Prosthecobacter fusiformis]